MDKNHINCSKSTTVLGFDCIKANHVHIWTVEMGACKQTIPRLRPILCEEERKRAQRFHFDRDRHLYILAHGALREILSRYLQQSPETITFSYTDKNKPYISDHPIQFNLSHSHQLVVIAIANTHPVGVDVEYIGKETHEALDIAKRYLAKEEYQQLIALPSQQQHRAFLDTWTRKEAFIKSVGEGLSYPLNEVVVNVPPLPAVAKLTKPSHSEESTWHLQTLDVPEEYVGTVAVTNCCPTLIYHVYD